MQDIKNAPRKKGMGSRSAPLLRESNTSSTVEISDDAKECCKGMECKIGNKMFRACFRCLDRLLSKCANTQAFVIINAVLLFLIVGLIVLTFIQMHNETRHGVNCGDAECTLPSSTTCVEFSINTNPPGTPMTPNCEGVCGSDYFSAAVPFRFYYTSMPSEYFQCGWPKANRDLRIGATIVSLVTAVFAMCTFRWWGTGKIVRVQLVCGAVWFVIFLVAAMMDLISVAGAYPACHEQFLDVFNAYAPPPTDSFMNCEFWPFYITTALDFLVSLIYLIITIVAWKLFKAERDILDV